MSFSARQIHCMQAMGLVPWISGEPANADSEQAREVDNVAPDQPRAVASRAPQPSDAPMPAGTDQLTQWLVLQPLVQLNYRGRPTQCIGAENAQLLVVCLQSDEVAQQAPLDNECAQLFDLMMRAINVPRTGHRQCAISAKPRKPADQNSPPMHIEDIVGSGTRAVLVLDPQHSSDSADAQSLRCVLPSSSIPLWRIAHPSLLLETPALKRTAWETLKVLRQVLER